MFILGFIVLLVVVGFFIGLLVEEEETAFGIILVITIIWAFIFGPWAIATFIELLVGYGIGLSLSRDRESIDYFEGLEGAKPTTSLVEEERQLEKERQVSESLAREMRWKEKVANETLRKEKLREEVLREERLREGKLRAERLRTEVRRTEVRREAKRLSEERLWEERLRKGRLDNSTQYDTTVEDGIIERARASKAALARPQVNRDAETDDLTAEYCAEKAGYWAGKDEQKAKFWAGEKRRKEKLEKIALTELRDED